MDLQFIPISFILISLVIIIRLIYKKIPEIKKKELEYISVLTQKKIKLQLIEKRLKTKFKQNKVFKLFENHFRKSLNFLNFILQKYDSLLSKLKFKKLEITQDNTKFEKILEEVSVLINQKKYQEAEEKLINILKIDPKNIKAYEKLVEVYVLSKELKHAEATMEYLIKLCRTLKKLKIDYFINLTEIKNNLEKFGDAKHYIEKAYEIESENPKVLDLYLKICLNNKDFKKAKKILKKLQKINPEDEHLKKIEKSLK